MRVQDVIADSLAAHHRFLADTVADCSLATLQKRLPGSSIGSIVAIYAHVVYSEDSMVTQVFQRRPTLFEADGWGEKLGIQMPERGRRTADWAPAYDLEAFRQYADAVREQAQAYVRALADTDMERRMPAGPLGELPLAVMLNNLLVGHLAEHWGEIAALKGALGLKGLSF